MPTGSQNTAPEVMHGLHSAATKALEILDDKEALCSSEADWCLELA